MLKANGKYIDTLPIAHLFSQEEHRADAVYFEVDRYHDLYDLSQFSFFMRGVTESGGETEDALELCRIGEDTLQLVWNVGQDFTAEGGTLSLDMFARGEVSGISEPVILRYQLPAVEVRRLPDAVHQLDSRSYTQFLQQVRQAAEDGIARMNAIEAGFRYDMSDSYDASIAALTETVGLLPAIVILTKSEYENLEQVDAGTLYILHDTPAAE